MDISKLSADEVIEALKGCSDEVRAKCKDYLNTPTEEEKKAAEDKAKAEEEAKKKAEEEAKAEADKKAAEDAEAKAKEEEEAKKKAEEDKQKACDAAVEEYKKVLALAADCKSVFGNVSTDGVKTEQDFAVKVCALDSAPKFLKDCKPESAVAALKGFVAGKAGTNASNGIVGDGKPTTKASFADYMANR
jgi:membrane protein involved in colicin uptake